MQLIKRARVDERGSALITALLATAMMLALGLALLSIVDTQAKESASERTRDRAFNLSESVLTSQAFVLGRNWPASIPPGDPACNAAAAGFGDIVGADTTPSAATARLRPNLNASYTDAAYEGATWQVNVCDDIDGSTVWSDSLLTGKNYDANGNNKVWVRAQSTVEGRTRVLVGLVQVRTTPAIPSRFGLVSGNLTDDLGSTVNNITANALGGVLSGLLGSTPTVAPDPAVPGSGITGVRCGLLDLQVLVSTCVTGTVAALGAVPLVSTLLGNKYEQFPTVTTTSPANIGQLRRQAQESLTYAPTSPGGASAVCAIPPAAGPSTVVFIEKVGTGDQSCVLNVPLGGLSYRAVVVGSGRIILRGAPIAAGAPVSTTSRTFTGVVYALNLQRHPVADGGLGLGDAATPGREVIRIESGAHVKGGVYADGKSAKVGIDPPNLTLNTNSLVNSLLCPGLLCTLAPTLNGLLGVLGVDGTVDALINGTCLLRVLGICTLSLPGLGLDTVVGGLVNQLNPQRAVYGSAIVTHKDTIETLKVYGASGVVPGSFRDMQPR
ncbi:MAG: hypothetical protein Q8O56_04910 [Solirubrobacteraceae bacterium]|nr:hypothetical protein [Solirubrobacteraceae bacterium]